MSSENQAKDAEVKMPADRKNAGNTEKLDPQVDDDAPASNSQDRTAVVTIKAKSKDLKEHPTPSFQEIDAPDSTLASTSTKVEEMRSSLAAIAEQTIDRSQANPEQKPPVNQSA